MSRPEVLVEREKTHGDFVLVSKVAQDIKKALRWRAIELEPEQREALDLIATKMARIVCGNPNYKDHWQDIIGYANLGLEGCS